MKMQTESKNAIHLCCSLVLHHLGLQQIISRCWMRNLSTCTPTLPLLSVLTICAAALIHDWQITKENKKTNCKKKEYKRRDEPVCFAIETGRRCKWECKKGDVSRVLSSVCSSTTSDYITLLSCFAQSMALQIHACWRVFCPFNFS